MGTYLKTKASGWALARMGTLSDPGAYWKNKIKTTKSVCQVNFSQKS